MQNTYKKIACAYAISNVCNTDVKNSFQINMFPETQDTMFDKIQESADSQVLSNHWYVLMSVASWSLLYVFFLKINHLRSSEWNCRIIAMVHSLVASRLSEASFISDGENPFKNIGEKNSHFQNIVLISSSGYFIFDFIWCIIMGTEGVMMVMHHVISIFSLIGGLYLNHSGSEICITLWGSELTNTFLQTRWFLRETKQYDTSFGTFNDFTFFGIFSFTRMGIGTGLAYLFFKAEKTIIPIKVGGFFFWLISILWFWQIWKFVKRRYFSKKELVSDEKQQ